MRLLIFGATGTIGRQLVIQSLALGHEVFAFTRNPNSLQDLQNRNLQCVKGDVMKSDEVEKVVQGMDAVFCALGDGRAGNVRAAGTANIVRAMEKAGIKRFICQSTLGAGDSKGNLDFFWKYIMFGWLLKKAYLDHELQEKYVINSQLDWTIVRPGAFTNGEATGQYRHGFDGYAKGLKLKISRADVALFMLMQLTTGDYVRKTPGLSY